MENNTANPIQVSERIFKTIEYLAQNGPSGLLELSKELQLNKTTVHRILNSLMCMDYVKQNPETSKYSLGFKICGIANQVLAQTNAVDFVRPYIQKLAEQTGEIVHLVQINGTNAVYIDKVDVAQNSVRLVSMVGKSIPLYCSGVGKALLADMDDDTIKSIWNNSKIEKHTEYTVTNFTDFMQLIRDIRRDGYALDNEENELGVRCVAVSLKYLNEKSIYAISLSAPKDRMSDERIAELKDLILQTKADILQQTEVL